MAEDTKRTSNGVETQKHLFFFVGRTASGKETQGKMLAEKLGYQVFSTGDTFREIIASGSQLGNRIKTDYDKGLLQPTWIADFMFQDFVFNLPPEEGAVFEGSGRDRGQAETIEKVCTWLGRPYLVFNLLVSPETVIERSLKRKRDSTDSEETIKTRLSEYEKRTQPAIDYFHSVGKCVDIDGEKSVDEIHDAILSEVQLRTS